MPRNLFKDGADLPFDELNKRMYGKYSAYYKNWVYYGWSCLVEDMSATGAGLGEFQKIIEFKTVDSEGTHKEICNVLFAGPKGVVQFKAQHAPLAGPDTDRFIVLKMGHHSPEPIYEGQQPTLANCRYLDGRCCYFNECSRQVIDSNTSMYSEEGSEVFWYDMFGLYVYFFEPDNSDDFFTRYPYELFDPNYQ